MGFSKKRFFVILVLSILILGCTSLIQVFDTEDWNFLLLGGSSCSVTGFPIRECISSANKGLLLSVGLVNVAFWFLLINLLYFYKKIWAGMLSLLLWVITIVLQKELAFPHCFSSISWYKLTGYPITDCITKAEKHIIFPIYITNIAFWFLVISLVQRLVRFKYTR